MPINQIDTTALAPLSAGDLLDRIVRLYRQHWIALMRVAILPVLLSYLATLAMTFGARNFALNKGDMRLVIGALLVSGGLFLFVLSKGVLLILLGGVAQSLTQNFMNGAPVRASAIFQVVRQNFWRLFGAVIFALIMLIFFVAILYFVLVIAGLLVIASTAWLLSALPAWVQTVLAILFTLAAIFVLAVLWVMTYKRAAFLPQIITVENKSVSNALSRCFALAGSELKHRDFLPAIALVFFHLYIFWSVVLLFLVPVFIYAELNNFEVGLFSANQPVWYTILYNTLSQASDILITPILLIGFVLLYIDSRVRREGFDLELLANRYLPTETAIIPHGDFPLEIPKPKQHDDFPPPGTDSFNSDGNLTVLSLR